MKFRLNFGIVRWIFIEEWNYTELTVQYNNFNLVENNLMQFNLSQNTVE